MFRLCDKITFCIHLSTDLDRCPTSSFTVSSNSTKHPPSTSTIYYVELLHFVPGILLAVLSASLVDLLSVHGQLISITTTCFLFLPNTLVSILFAHLSILCIDRYIPESFSLKCTAEVNLQTVSVIWLSPLSDHNRITAPNQFIIIIIIWQSTASALFLLTTPC